MIHQIVEIHEENRYLSLERGFLKISKGEEAVARVPLDDVAVLLISAQSVSFSKHILNELAERGGISVLCGKNYAPQSMVIPVSGHYMQSGVIKTQIDASVPFKKNIWKRVIEEKLENQAKSLALCGNHDAALRLKSIAKTVKSGDSDNREAYGAKVYWKALFGGDFIRDKDGEDVNALLNYGYAIARASIARAICAAGLLPSFGIYHKNQLNPFCLADDFLEPFRPLIDISVYQLAQQKQAELTPEIKRRLTDILWVQVKTTEGKSPLFQGMHYMCSAYTKALKEKKSDFDIPVWEGKHETVSASE
ncbi:type II CRISPR-associated endonuclease Cas1 [Treponema endosymbiont of Eucomonympha sp.]|uniref:type II CRISPR-associated endonuclease Cas1 n=1 Tax=Treponema endosymbiont of Eucomonympha sp. TaxID=1580831 RepID=UPI000784ED87|nr:type II CRISPR-associated endonuclease Cas1 [Treponema endosymbiont of Eucomonympha sp.]